MNAADGGNDTLALVLSGGTALGAYQAGAYTRLQQRHPGGPSWIAGSSTGAINGALIAGNAADHRVDRLRALWRVEGAAMQERSSHADLAPVWRHLANWSSAVRTRLAGAPGHFRPRAPTPFGPFKSLYDLAPLRARLSELVDFDRLNAGEIRLTIATTDIETGELVLFDTHRGERIGPDHLLASCGFLPEFAPVEIGGRLLGDGGLAANAPIEALRDHGGALTCYVIDLFPRDGERPNDLEGALARKSDLVFANQTWQRLEAFCREARLRHELDAVRHSRNAGDTPPRVAIYCLSYRPEPSEAGPERMFDYSDVMIARRWQAGADDMEAALCRDARRTSSQSVVLMPVRREAGRPS